MSLKLGVATYAYLWECSLNRAIEQCARFGFRFLEIMTTAPHLSPREFGPWERKLLARQLANSGVQAVALNPTYLDLNLISLNEDFRKLTIDEMLANIRLASDIGARIIILVPGRRHGLIPAPHDISLDIAKDGISRCLEEAEKRGVILGLENAPNNFLETGQQILEMVNEFHHPNLRVVFDVANATMVESPADGLRTVKEYLVHVHLSDTEKQKWGHLPIGQGVVQFKEVATVLQEIGFEGTSILEITRADDLERDFAASLSVLQQLGWET